MLIPEDLNYVVNRLPTDVRKLLKTGQVYLAGGFIRSCIANEPTNDIDLWGRDAEQLKVTAQLFAGERKVRCMMTDNACTILTPGRTPVQFITRWTYHDPVKLAESFDFSIASAVIWYDLSGGWRSWCHDAFYADLAAKRLRYLFPARNEDAGGSMLRMTKFLGRGYRIAPESLAGLVARMNQGIRHDDFLQKDEGHQARVYAGLLREVDPLNIVDGCEVLGTDEKGSNLMDINPLMAHMAHCSDPACPICQPVTTSIQGGHTSSLHPATVHPREPWE